MGVHVGPRVLHLAGGFQHGRDDRVELRHQFEHLIIRQVLQGELPLTGVPRIGLPQDGVAVTGHDLTALQHVLHVLLQLVVGGVEADVVGHLVEENKHLLVGQSVQRPGQTAHSGGEGQVRVGESGADQVSGVSGDVAAFVIAVNGQVQPHQFGEHRVLVIDHVGEVEGPILVGIDGRGVLAFAVQVVVNGGRHDRQFSDQVHGVLEDGLPVSALMDAVGVGFGELGFGVEGGDGRRELGHGMHAAGKVVQHGDHVGG